MSINSLINIMSPAPFKKPITNKIAIDKAYRYWRIRIFYSIYVGYVFFYFTRKSFTFVIPELINNMHFTYKEIGLLSSALYIAYGISKFISGILSDKCNPRYFMSIGLIFTGFFNIFFGMSNSIGMLMLFCILNGIFQGWGWPPVTKQLTYWYSKKERGIWWSSCSTSHSVGGLLIPMIMAYAVAYFASWRYAMLLPGILCIGMGFILLNRLRDIPQSLGLPPIELYKNEYIEADIKKEANEKKLTSKQILFERVLNNKIVWILAISYFFVYVVRTAVNDLTVPYLVDIGYDRLLASISVLWFEIGGFAGMLAAGWASDIFFKGKRIPFILLCATGMAITLFIFLSSLKSGQDMKYCYLLMACIGFFVFGPQMLIGLAAAEYVDKKAVCTANGFVGCWAYVGAAATGYPLGLIIDYSWQAYFWILIACCIMIFLIMWPFTFKISKHISNA